VKNDSTKEVCDLRRSDRLKTKEKKNYRMYDESIEEGYFR